MDKLSPEQLAQHWSAIHSGAGQAVDWISEVRRNAPRLDNEADHLILKMRRIRNLARRLGAVSALPMTVGFFGLSQAGKSYLISTLAAGANGKLETDLGGQRLDFITHVNPPGGGKEATGLVTRFSRTAQPGPAEFPIELKLFGEVEVAKILANSFFNDFNTEKFQYEYNDARVRQLLKELGKRKQHQPAPGVSADDVVDLWDYLQDRFPGSLKQLNGHYWPTAVELAPFLPVEDRAKLFTILWGEIPELTETYHRFSQTLASLRQASTVYAPLDALVNATPQGGLSQADSIMNVDMLERLGKVTDKNVTVQPCIDGELQPPVTLSLAQLAALTAELIFPLAEKTREPLFEEVDLLDFPGYRGRLNVESLDDVRRAVKSDDANPVAQLILRGKVAYLFERYTDSQEMNVLIVCTPSNKQSDVTSVGPVLTEWIARTQGSTPEIRARRQSGLLWAITMFDMRIGNSLDMGEDLLQLAWGNNGMMKMAMLERFGQYAWMQEWVPGKPFNNTFLVRKPRMKVAFLELEDGEEKAVNTSLVPHLERMRRTFVADETVREHVHEPAAAWDAMMTLNDGGMGSVTGYLQNVARRQFKLERIREQMDDLVHDLVENRLGPWFLAEGAGEMEKKKKIAQQIVDALKPRALLIGEFLHRLQLPDELLRTLYLRADDEPVSEQGVQSGGAEEPAAALNLGGDLVSLGDDLDLFGSSDTPATGREKTAASLSSGSDARFAQAVLREWINHLRNIAEDQRLMAFLGFPKAAVEALVAELITAANRLNLHSRLLNTIASTEQVGTKREQLVDRQVLTARTVLADFIAWLGFIDMPLADRPDSIANKGAKLFEPPPMIPPGTLPKLPAQPINHTGSYLFDWLVGLSKIAMGNAGHSAGREITPEQNADLGRIIATFNSTRTK
jgi:hypothetical protein